MLGSWDLKNWMVFSDGESEGKYGKINTNNWYMQMILEVIRSLYCNLSPAQSSNSQVCFFCYSSSDWLVRFRMSECCKKSRSLTDFLKMHWSAKILKNEGDNLITFYLLSSPLANVFLSETIGNSLQVYVQEQNSHNFWNTN